MGLGGGAGDKKYKYIYVYCRPIVRTIVKAMIWKQPKCPLAVEWLIYTQFIKKKVEYTLV